MLKLIIAGTILWVNPSQVYLLEQATDEDDIPTQGCYITLSKDLDNYTDDRSCEEIERELSRLLGI